MNILLSKEVFEKRKPADLLIAPVWEGGKLAAEGVVPEIASLLKLGDFQGNHGETALLYPEGGQEARLLLLGLGKREEITSERVRRAIAAAVKVAKAKKSKKLNFLFPRDCSAFAVVEGFLLSNYAFTGLKQNLTESETSFVETLKIFGLTAKFEQEIERSQTICKAVDFARDLVNRNADDVTPQRFAMEAAEKLKHKKIQFSLIDCKQLEKEKMGLLLAVGKGATSEPCMIQASYSGNPHSKECILLVGKGVTYDTGGLCLKTPDNMVSMKADMAGAAAVVGAVKAAAELGLKVNVTALAPLAENAIGSASYKQGDVYRSTSGKSVEILNTDAEGRLILADAIAYGVKHLQPTLIIDAATLTGAMVIALGEEISGFFSNDSKAAKELETAAEISGETIWEMPLYDYKESLRSDIADLTNMGGREAGAMKAALFLQEFTNGLPWIHIDMAGPAYLAKPKHYNSAKGTGWGVRLLAEFLELRARK